MRKVYLMLVCAFSAHSEIVQHQFEDPSGTTKVVMPSSNSDFPLGTTYLNSAKNHSLLASSGLSRKIEVEITQDNGNWSYRELSDVVRVEDRLSDLMGREFYGKEFTVPSSIPEGNHEIVKRIYDNYDNLISTDVGELIIDVTAPTVGSISASPDLGYGSVSGNLIVNGVRYISTDLNGVKDNVDIESVQITAKHLESEEMFGPFNVDVEGGVVSIGKEPFQRKGGNYQLDYLITDLAGNQTNVSYTVSNQDIETPPFDIVAIRDTKHPDVGKHNLPFPDAEQYVEYKEGMTIYSNPVYIVARLDRDEHKKYSDHGLGYAAYCEALNCLDETILHEQGNDVYVRSRRERGIFEGRSEWRSANAGMHLRTGEIEIKFDSNTPIPPKPISRGLWRETTQQWDDTWQIRDQAEIFDKFRVVMEPREHTQRIRVSTPRLNAGAYNGVSTTYNDYYLEPGETELIVDNPTSFSWKELQELGHSLEEEPWRVTFHVQTYINDTTLRGEDYHAYYDVDTTPAELTSYHYDQSTQQVVVRATETNTTPLGRSLRAPSWHPSYQLTNIQAIDIHGISHPLAHDKEVELSNYIRDFYFSTADLAEGDYESIVINLVDNFHNVAVHTKEMSLTVDRSPPDIALSVNGEDFIDGQDVIGLESIEITITDENYPRVTSIEMQGGPVDDHVMLNWLVESDDRLKYVATLEYPRIFPSLEPGEEYTLTITASDDFGNERVNAYTLAYQPANLVRVESISVFPIDSLLTDRADNPLNVIVSNELRTEQGELASGDQSVMITLRSDANYPVHVIDNTITVSPGETVEFVYNINNSQGKLYIPIFSAENGVQGDSEFMLSIPLLEAN